MQQIEDIVPRGNNEAGSARIFGRAHACRRQASQPVRVIDGDHQQRRGRPKPNEFGKMVKPEEAENQIVIDYEVYDRRPNDADLLIPAIDAHQARLGRLPYLVAADAAFYSGKNEAAAKAKGVKRVCVGSGSA